MNKIFVLLFFIFSISFGLPSTVPGIVLSDQIGNSLNYAELINPDVSPTNAGNHQRVQQNIDDIFVTKSGKVYTRSLYDEGGKSCSIYKDGKLIGSILTCVSNVTGQNGAIDGYSNGNSIFVTQTISYDDGSKSGFGISVSSSTGWPSFRYRSGGYYHSYLKARTYGGVPSKAYMSLDEVRNRLYLVDGVDTLYTFNTETYDSMPISKIYVNGLTNIAAKNNTIWGVVENELRLFDNNGIYQNKKITLIKKPTKIKWSYKNELVVYDDSTNMVYFIKNPGQTNQTYRTFGIKNGYYSTGGIHKDQTLNPNLNGIGVDSLGNTYFSWGWWPTPTNSDLRSFDKNGKLRWRISCFTFVQVPGFDERSDGRDVYYLQTRHGINYSKSVSKKDSQVSYTYKKSIAAPQTMFDGTTYIRWINNRKYLFQTAMTGGGFQVFKFSGEFKSYITRVYTPVGVGGDNFGWYVDTLGTVWQTMGSPIRKYQIQNILPNGDLVYDVNNPIVIPVTSIGGNISPRRLIYDPTTDDMIVAGYNTEYPYDGDWQTAGHLLGRISNFSTNKQFVWLYSPDTVATSVFGDIKHTLKSISVSMPYIFAVYGARIPQTVAVYNYSDGAKIGEIYPGPEIGGDYKVGGYKVEAGLGWTDMMYSIASTKRSNGEYVILVEDDVNCKTTMYRWCPSGTCDMSK